MHFKRINGRRYAQFENMCRTPGLVHAFSTRPLDTAIHGDEQCAANRQLMMRDFERDPEQLCSCRQVHQPHVAIVTEASGPRLLRGFDAVTTNVTGVTLMLFSADCPLVLIYDPERGVVGAAHASWRCTTARILRRLIDVMVQQYDSRPESLLAGIGPSAGPLRYEVKEDVFQAAAGLPDVESCFPRRDGRMYFDMWRANRLQLEAAGVPSERIEIAGICTLTSTEVFYSYRLEGPGCGHICLMAGLG